MAEASTAAPSGEPRSLRGQHEPPPFSRWMLTGCLLVPAMLISLSIWQRWSAYRQLEEDLVEDHRLCDLHHTIKHLDEVLSMSARMAAATGDPSWEKRYREHEPDLDFAIQQLVQEAREEAIESAAEATRAANQALVRMENQAFDLVRQNRLADAMKTLDSPEYQHQKAAYTDSLTRVTGKLDRRIADRVHRSHRFAYVGTIFFTAALLFTLAVWVGVFYIIRRSATALQASREELQAVNDCLVDGLAIADVQTRSIIHVNQAMCQLFGYSESELLTKRADDLHPPDAVAQVMQEFEALSQGRTKLVHNIPCKRSDGSIFFADIGSQPIELGGQSRLIGFFRDVTEQLQNAEALRASEERFQSAFEYAAIGMALVGLDGRWLRVNRSTCEIVGYTAEELLGRTFQEVTHPNDLEADMAHVQRMLKGEIRTYQMEKRYIHKQGHVVWVLLSVSLVRDNRGRPMHFISQIQDISDRKRAEEERELLQGQLRQAQKMEAVGRLAGGIAHDFNNLLTVIQGNTGVAAFALQPEMTERDVDRVAGALEEIEQAAERASNLTAQLLTFSRKHIPRIHVLDVSGVIRNMERILRRLIRENITLEIHHRPGRHLIRADVTQVEQILINLAVNAADAMPEGGRLSIEVTTVNLDEPHPPHTLDARSGPHVLIRVSDTGVGMDSYTLEHLFEPFFTTKPFGKGSGLGLAIVYGIIKQAGGHITVESPPGRGSTFCVYFPAAEGEVTAPAESPDAQWESGNETVLLCEDEPSLRRLAVSILSGGGYAIIEAESGEEAVRLAAEHRGEFHLLITDVVMPGMNGDKVAAAILEDQPDVRVLFISGYASDVLNVEAMVQRRFEFLQKPFKPAELLQRVRKMLDHVS